LHFIYNANDVKWDLVGMTSGIGSAGAPIISPSSNGTAVVAAYLCNANSSGDHFINDEPISPNEYTQTITANVTAIGTYNITVTANGITFEANGTFTNTGAQDIILRATGKPLNGVKTEFTLNTTPNCSFEREVYSI
jgi:hypothetical protein